MTLFEVFNQEYEAALIKKGEKTYEDVFDEVNEAFRLKHKFEAFRSYETFRSARKRKRKRKQLVKITTT